MAWPSTGWSKSIPVRLSVGCPTAPLPTLLICIPLAAMSNKPLATIVAHNPTATIKSINSNLRCIGTSTLFDSLLGLAGCSFPSLSSLRSPPLLLHLVVAFRSLLGLPLGFFHRRLGLRVRSDPRRLNGSPTLRDPGIVLIHRVLIHERRSHTRVAGLRGLDEGLTICQILLARIVRKLATRRIPRMIWQHRRVGQGKARHSDEQKTPYDHREKSHNKTPFVAHMIFSTKP